MTKKQEPKKYIITEELLIIYKNLVGALTNSKQQLLSANELQTISARLSILKEYKEAVAEEIKKEEERKLKNIDKILNGKKNV